MKGYRLDRIRRRIGLGMLVVTGSWVTWTLLPGLPVFLAPRANAEVKAVGLALFEHEWRPHDAMAKGDGLGPVFNARSCVACHFQGGVGGGGDNKHNVVAFEAHPTRDRPEVKGGLIHKFAVENRFFEGRNTLQSFFPIVPNGITVESGCQVFTLDFDPIHTETVNSTALFGAGWIDRISSKSITHQHMTSSVSKIARELDSDFGGPVP
ncbi:di-heme oxidoredictase family protein, partial [Singulisphaera rosea]